MMKKGMRIFVTVVLVVVAAAAVVSAQSRVGVVDLAIIIDESRAGKEANAVLDAFIAERQQEADELAARWQELADALEADDGSLSDEERGALQAEVEAAAVEYAAAVEQFELEIAMAIEALREQILSDIGIVLQRVGDARGFDMIVDSSSVYYYRRVVDLTFEVIREYDDLWELAQRQGVQ